MRDAGTLPSPAEAAKQYARLCRRDEDGDETIN